jgi:hypothetical protein
VANKKRNICQPRCIQAYRALLYFLPQEWHMGIAVAEIQPTPNPNALKFVLDRPVSDQPASFFNSDSAQDHPLASKLFQIGGVSSLLLLGDFVTVNKLPEASWPEIKRGVKKVLSEAP